MKKGAQGVIPLKIDIHVHTAYSDSTACVYEVVKVAKEKGLDGIVITDHETVEGAEVASSNTKDLIILSGEEVETTKGHILAIGIVNLIGKGLSPRKAISEIHEQNGLAIVPHPTFPLFKKLSKREIYSLLIDGLEVFSAATPFPWHYLRRNLKLLNHRKLPMLAGSDSHFSETVGDAYTIIHAETRDEAGILQAIKQGKTTIRCQPSKTIHKVRMLKKMGSSLLHLS